MISQTMKRIFIFVLITSVVFLLAVSNLNHYYVTFSSYTNQNIANLKDQKTIEKSSGNFNSESAIKCTDKNLDMFVDQRGEFFVLYNYVAAEKRFKCFESVTYTTQADVTFMDNLIPLVERWRGPISVSIYAPGSDFRLALQIIAYLRNCGSPLIKQLVSFHLFFEGSFVPEIFEEALVDREKIYKDFFNCSCGAPFSSLNSSDVFKLRNKLLYPINVARNSARKAAQTHFVLASDIELYPSRNLTQKFLEMIAEKPELLSDNENKVFVLPVFEIKENVSVPANKTELQELIKKKKAFVFHERLCQICHRIPEYLKWISSTDTGNLDVFTSSKRNGKYGSWEPFYIGTNNDPIFDERLTWEGQSNKMTQNYIQCLLDYNYIILNNAFLVHKPGIKKVKQQIKNYSNMIKKTNQLIRSRIKKELTLMYGSRKGCKI